MRTYPRRKLSYLDGQYILWHVLEHLEAITGSERYLDGLPEAIENIRALLREIIAGDTL